MNELGRFELSVLTAVARQHGGAYGVSVMDEVSNREGRAISYGAAYTTLERLQHKGFLISRMGEPTAERGGRRKRHYTVTGKGEAALQQAWSRHENRFSGLDWLAPKPAGS